jgi:hypothetical protein
MGPVEHRDTARQHPAGEATATLCHVMSMWLPHAPAWSSMVTVLETFVI